MLRGPSAPPAACLEPCLKALWFNGFAGLQVLFSMLEYCSAGAEVLMGGRCFEASCIPDPELQHSLCLRWKSSACRPTSRSSRLGEEGEEVLGGSGFCAKNRRSSGIAEGRGRQMPRQGPGGSWQKWQQTQEWKDWPRPSAMT